MDRGKCDGLAPHVHPAGNMQIGAGLRGGRKQQQYETEVTGTTPDGAVNLEDDSKKLPSQQTPELPCRSGRCLVTESNLYPGQSKKRFSRF